MPGAEIGFPFLNMARIQLAGSFRKDWVCVERVFGNQNWFIARTCGRFKVLVELFPECWSCVVEVEELMRRNYRRDTCSFSSPAICRMSSVVS